MTDATDKAKENIKIAVQGCCHGELDKIYETLSFIEKSKGMKIDLLLCCGDFQAVRNQKDLESMAVPPKYRKMGIFHQYYTGAKIAPVLTIFIGGNHEAANHLWELPFGGWVAPNIYYLGYAGVVEFGGLKIGGISGIYKSHDYYKGHFEMPTFNESTKRSFYHTRNYEVFKLKVLKGHLDIFLSHDWPKNIYNHGNVNDLLQKKTFFKKEIDENTLGNPACEELLNKLKPSYWFSGHLHVKFSAIVEHKNDEDPDKIQKTKFLALDKCLPHRDFLQVLDMGPTDAPKELRYNKEWLAITKMTYKLYNATPRATWLPDEESEYEKYRASEEVMVEVLKNFEEDFKIPSNFEVIQSSETKSGSLNNQTIEYCEQLGIDNPCNLTIVRKIEKFGKTKLPEQSSKFDSSSSDDFEEIPKIAGDPSEISLDDSSDDDDAETSGLSSTSFTKSSDVDSSNDFQTGLKRKLSSEEQSDDSCSPRKPTFLVRRNKALYASLDDDNSGSSSSDCL